MGSYEDYLRNREARARAAKELADKQNQSKRDQWGAVGDFFTGIPKAYEEINPLGPRGLARNAVGAAGAIQGAQQGIGGILSMLMPKRGNPQQIPMSRDNGMSTDDRRDKAMAGRQGMGPNSFGPAPRDPIDDILARLGEDFTYDGSQDESFKQNSSALDQMFNSRMTELNGLKDQSRQNFNESDGNVAAMHSAFQNEVLGQAPAIQQRGDQAQAQIGGIFDKTIQSNNAGLEAERASKLEMLQRLGIAPAANAPDEFSAAVQQGNNAAQQSRDSRQSEQAINTQTDLSRNTQLANSIGNDGVARRSDLNNRLQEILGSISGKEADIQGDFQQSKMEMQNNGEDRAYQRWLADRQFDMGLFNSLNANQNKQNEIAAKGQSSGLTGIGGLNANTSPQLQNAIIDVSRRVNIARDPEKAMEMLSDPKYRLNPNEVFEYVTNYGKLGSNNKYPDPSEY